MRPIATTAGTETTDIVGIQYLRGIAAVMVAAGHAALVVPSMARWTAWGYTGVDIFFVISGFIMAYTTRAFDPQCRRAEAATFMRRRLTRIVPLYWLALLWTIKVPIVRGEFASIHLRDFWFLPRLHSTGNIWPELVAGWTINYEMFFYAAFALAMLFGARRYLVLALTLISLVALGAALHPEGPSGMFYTSPLLLEFLMGVALFHIGRQFTLARPALVAITLLAFVLLALDNGPLPRAFADGLPAVVIVWAVAQLGVGTRVRWLHHVGDASFSIYLFHLGTLALVERAVSAGLNINAVPAWASLVMLTALAVSVGLLLHRQVEKPLLRLIQAPRVPVQVTTPHSATSTSS